MAARRNAVAPSRAPRRVLRRPAAASERRPRSRAMSSTSSRLRASTSPRLRAASSMCPQPRAYEAVVAVDTNTKDCCYYPVFMVYKDGGLLTLEAGNVKLNRPKNGGHFIYQLVVEQATDDERSCTGVCGTLQAQNTLGWLTRSAFFQLARRLGSSAVNIVSDE
jgi:hypothetical protein